MHRKFGVQLQKASHHSRSKKICNKYKMHLLKVKKQLKQLPVKLQQTVVNQHVVVLQKWVYEPVKMVPVHLRKNLVQQVVSVVANQQCVSKHNK